MKILVTGGAGFIGGHVADAYVAAGHDVVVVDDLSTGRRSNLNPGARFYQVDIRSDEIGEIVAKEKPQVLNNHAAQMDVRRSVADPVFDAQVNLIGLLNLLEHGRHNGLQRIIFASSGVTVYGDQDHYPGRETDRTNPLSPYGVTKLATEKYLHFYRATYGISYCALRYANVYGPRQNPHGEAGVVAIFTLKMLHGEKPVINGDGKQARDYVFIEDVVRANGLALSSEYNGCLNIGTGIETDVNELFGMLKKLTGSDAPEHHGPAKPGEQARSALDPTLAGEKLGWRPLAELRDGLRLTVESFRHAEADGKGGQS
jgi:UDP-glucose 4-epimerase